jgi:hypothetical protein
LAKSDSIRSNEHKVYREPGSAIEGDRIMYMCRKVNHDNKLRGSVNHHYFSGDLLKNAYAVIVNSFKNINKNKQ